MIITKKRVESNRKTKSMKSRRTSALPLFKHKVTNIIFQHTENIQLPFLNISVQTIEICQFFNATSFPRNGTRDLFTSFSPTNASIQDNQNRTKSYSLTFAAHARPATIREPKIKLFRTQGTRKYKILQFRKTG